MTSHILDAYPEIYDSIRDSVTDYANNSSAVKKIFDHHDEEFSISVSQDYNSEKDSRLRFYFFTVPENNYSLEITAKKYKTVPVDQIPESKKERIKFFEEFTAESLEEAFTSMNKMWTPLRELDHFRVQAMDRSLER